MVENEFIKNFMVFFYVFSYKNKLKIDFKI